MTGDSLWARICATVSPLGKSRSKVPVEHPKRKPTIDLHGHTVHDAYYAALDFIDNQSDRDILIITGKGQISKELPIWLSRNSNVVTCTPINDGGAYQVRLQRKK